MNNCRQTPCLWKGISKNDEQERKAETVEDLVARFSSKPPPRPLWELVRNSLVVGQEFVLTCLLLTRHRSAMQHEDDPDQRRQVLSLVILPLIFVLVFGEQNETPAKRACDALLLAGMLRLVSSVLRTLTASYSSDTVYALAIAGMMVHLLACDYRYANGHSRKKTAGIVSLNASLFSTTLLASRLTSNATVYVFVSSSVFVFAFYPSARHSIAVSQSHASFGMLLYCRVVNFVCNTISQVRNSISSHQCHDFSRHVVITGNTARKNGFCWHFVGNLCDCPFLGIRSVAKAQDAT